MSLSTNQPAYRWTFLLPLLVTGFACDGQDPPGGTISDSVSLSTFRDCQDLETYIEDVAVKEMEEGLNGIGDPRIALPVFGGGRAEGDGSPLAPVSNANGPNANGPTDFTGTNNQVAGVEEADIVKTDGVRIYALAGGALHIASSWPASEMQLLATLPIEGYPTELLLDKSGRVVVISSLGFDGCGFPGAADIACRADFVGDGAPKTKVTIVQEVDGQFQVARRAFYFPGQYQAGRGIDGSVRLVLTRSFSLPEAIEWYINTDAAPDSPRYRDELLRVKEANRARIRAQKLQDWLASGESKDAETQEVEPFENDCRTFHRPNVPVRLGLATVVTLNLDAAVIRPTIESVLGDSAQVYASKDSLYLASSHWWSLQDSPTATFTYVHKFDIRDPSRALYRASGGFEGTLINQFAMDEHQGNLRVATTIDRYTPSEDDSVGQVEVTNRVSVLASEDGRLRVIGKTEDLAKGERIQSVRFMGDRGFVVTFLQVDPLFTLDLRVPEAPKVVGELKIPGFSSYLHPIGDDHILGIGTHVPETAPGQWPDWSERYVKLSLFDVSDLANPKEVFTQKIGDASGSSEAQFEHRAFNYFESRGVLAIPFASYSQSGTAEWGSFVSELRLFRVDVETGFEDIGSVDMADVFSENGVNSFSPFYSPWIRRSVMADDFVYAISDAGIRAAEIEAPSTPVSTVLFGLSPLDGL
jgi:uncharacterized secreted protein with C-terminal beta-propeller domain